MPLTGSDVQRLKNKIYIYIYEKGQKCVKHYPDIINWITLFRYFLPCLNSDISYTSTFSKLIYLIWDKKSFSYTSGRKVLLFQFYSQYEYVNLFNIEPTIIIDLTIWMSMSNFFIVYHQIIAIDHSRKKEKKGPVLNNVEYASSATYFD